MSAGHTFFLDGTGPCSRAIVVSYFARASDNDTVTGTDRDERHLLRPDPAVPQGLPGGREPGRRASSRIAGAVAARTTRRPLRSSSGASWRARSRRARPRQNRGREVPAGRRLSGTHAGSAEGAREGGQWPGQIIVPRGPGRPDDEGHRRHLEAAARVDGGCRTEAPGARDPKNALAAGAAGAGEPAARRRGLTATCGCACAWTASREAAGGGGSGRSAAADELADLFPARGRQAAQPVRDVHGRASSNRPTTRSTKCSSG